MRILIFGATGMVGQAALKAAMLDATVEEIVCVGRTPLGLSAPKLTELVTPDLFDLSSLVDRLVGFDTCLFCLGVSSGGMSEADYSRVTYELTLSIARALLPRNPKLCFQYVSGEGTDSTEQGGVMWARVKGRTENALLGLGFASAYMLRPGAIVPLDGIRSKTWAYQFGLTLFGWLIALLKPVMPGTITDTRRLGATMLSLVRNGYSKPIVRTSDINTIA